MNDCIWLEISNARIGLSDVDVQLKGDRTTFPEQTWWKVEPTAFGKDASETGQAILKALDSKRVVLAALAPAPEDSKRLSCKLIRIQFAESPAR